MAGGSINNGNKRGKLLSRDLVEEAEVNMKVITWIQVFYGYIGITGQVGSLGNNTGATRVGEFGDRLWQSCVYTKFGHMQNTMMGFMAKVLVDELIIEAEAHGHDEW